MTARELQRRFPQISQEVLRLSAEPVSGRANEPFRPTPAKNSTIGTDQGAEQASGEAQAGRQRVFRQLSGADSAAGVPQRPAGGALNTSWSADGKIYRGVIHGAPMGKPRMTQRDKWQKRPAVVRYRAWCDAARASLPDRPKTPSHAAFVAFLPIPGSWSKAKKAEMKNQPHRQKPDLDNITKAVFDALFREDSVIHAAMCEKRWDDGSGPRIVITICA